MDLFLNPRLFPTMMVIQDLLAAVAYARHGMWWHTGYWIAAAVLTTCVTYGMQS
jgi:hypothetical protein